MSSSENDSDSDVPEHVPLSTSKKQVIGRRKNVEKELALEKSKRKERNRARDRQLKERSLTNQQWGLTSDADSQAEPGEESLAKEEGRTNDSRFLPDHLFAAAFNRPSPTAGPRDAVPTKTQERKRKRADLTPKDKMIGRASIPPPVKSAN